MATEDVKERTENVRKAGEKAAEDMGRIGEAFTKAVGTFDLKGMSHVWKQGYLRGLEAIFQSQEQTGRLLKETVQQGITGSQQLLQSYGTCLEEFQGKAGAALPFVELSRQLVNSVHRTVEPLFANAADTTERAFTYYEESVARPSRNYAIDLNKKVIDTFISA